MDFMVERAVVEDKQRELIVKAAEIGILTYLAICNEETPRFKGNVMCFSSPVNTTVLKQALRVCACMDMEDADVEFEFIEGGEGYDD